MSTNENNVEKKKKTYTPEEVEEIKQSINQIVEKDKEFSNLRNLNYNTENKSEFSKKICQF